MKIQVQEGWENPGHISRLRLYCQAHTMHNVPNTGIVVPEIKAFKKQTKKNII